MLHTKFQAPEASNSEENFKYILFLIQRHPAVQTSWIPGQPFEQTWWRSTRQYYIPNINTLGLSVSEDVSFAAIVDDGKRTKYDGQRTKDGGHWLMAINHLEHMAQVS